MTHLYQPIEKHKSNTTSQTEGKITGIKQRFLREKTKKNP